MSGRTPLKYGMSGATPSITWYLLLTTPLEMRL